MNAFLILSALTVFQVDPWCNKPFLPSADPAGGIVVTNGISFAAAQGEFEAVSFVVRPDEDVAEVDVVASDLVGPGGAKIPAAAADVASVKVWFRPGGRWNTSWSGDLSHPVPINNLILHDDTLVKVDWEKKINYLRADYPDGLTYLNMRGWRPTHFDHDLEPVKDAPKFVPFDLKKDFRQQYLVTWKVPKDAKGGDYAGTLSLVSRPKGAAEKTLKTFKLALEVYPFALPRPRTHYDTREPYVSYWMGAPSLGGLLSGGYRLDRAEKKLRAIYRNMAEHNAINLSGVGTLGVDSTDDYALRTLLIARQEGLCADGLINGSAFDMGAAFVWNPGGKVRSPEKEPEDYKKSLDGFRSIIQRQNAILDKYLGHHRCYYQSLDECTSWINRASYGYWNIIHELGSRTWTDSGEVSMCGVFTDMNDAPADISPTLAWKWRASGAKSVTYSATFTGPENPDVWRRNKGIRFWYADFDGQHEYDFFDGGKNRWNDFIYYCRYCQFGIVYWTMDGLVSTLAWEAVRESLDDIRYFSLLRLRAEAALKSSDAATRKLGREALVWQDGIDPEYVVDLNAHRRETADWIKRLVAKAGPQPADVDTELPPPATLPPDSRWQKVPKPSAGAKAVFDYAEGMVSGNRYDLALAALEGLLADEATSSPDCVRAAVRMAELHARLKERPAAVAVLDRALALDRLSKADLCKLNLKRGATLMAPMKFEEEFTAEQLAAARASIDKGLKSVKPSADDAGEGDRADAIGQLMRGYLSARDWQKAVDYAEARAKDAGLSDPHRADLLVSLGEAYNGQKEWTKALGAFKRAHTANGSESGAFLRRVLNPEAYAAEMAKEYELAVSCKMKTMKFYDPVDDVDKIKVIKNDVARLSKLSRKNLKTNESFEQDSDGEISLDE